MADYLRVAIQSLGGEKAWRSAFDESYSKIQRAAQFTIEDAANIGKRVARRQMGAAGFSRKFQNAFRVEVYPNYPKASVNAAAFFFSAIGYAGIFDYGVSGNTITGRPLLWIPLPGVPKRIRGKRTRPRLWRGKMFLVKPPSVKHPTLFGKLRGEVRPLFIGLDQVELRKRFTVVETIDGLQAQLPSIFAKYMSVIDGR